MNSPEGPVKSTHLELMEQFDIEGLVRTGLTGLKRGKSERPEELNQKNN